MEFKDWIAALPAELVRTLGYSLDDATRFVDDTSPEWREMFDDGLSPAEAADEEAHAASWMHA